MKMYFAVTGLALAAGLSATASPINVLVDADAQRNSASNFSNGDLIQTRDNGRQAYLRFDISGLADIQTASLNVLRYDPDDGAAAVDVYGLLDSADDWTEDGSTPPPYDVVGNGAVATLLADDFDTSASALPGGTQGLGGVWITLGLTNAIVDFMNADADGIVTLVLVGDAAFPEKFYFPSKEAGSAITNTPGITAASNPFGTEENPNFGAYLTATEVPEPASAALLACGLATLIRRRSAA